MTRNFIPKASPFPALTTTGLDGTSTSVTYNARGQLQTVTNAKGDVTELIYERDDARWEDGPVCRGELLRGRLASGTLARLRHGNR